MEKRLIATMVAAAFAGTASVAVAGPISVASIGTYAAETIGAATGAIKLGNVAYTLTSPFAIASTQTIEYFLGLGAAKVNTCPTVAIIDSIANTSPVGVTIGAPVLSGSSCKYSVTTTTNSVPANSLVNFTNALADKSAGALLVGGGSLVADVKVYNSLGSQVEGNQATVAVAAQALGAAWQASAPSVTGSLFVGAAGIEASKVDVTASPVATAFTTSPADVTASNATIVLGAFALRNGSGSYLDSDGVTPVNIAALTTNKWSLTVTGPFITNTNAGAVFASSVPACTDNKGNFALASGTATLNFDAIAAGLATTSPQAVYVCYTPELGLTTKAQIPTGQFNGSATTTAGTALTGSGMQGETAAGPLYSLGSNGASIDVRVMTTAATTGWSTVLRIINTGSIAAPVSGTYILNDGTLGASGPLVASLAPGATVMLSSAQVEAALAGTPGASPLPISGNPPRIRISAPTNSLRVQAWVQSPNGAWFMGTPAQGDDANKTSFVGVPVEPQ